MHKTSIVCYPKSVGKDLQYQEMLLLMFCLQLILGTSAYYNVIDCLDIAFPTIYTFSVMRIFIIANMIILYP